ncbi:MAG: RtcB family protein [Deferribacterota bacterium]|nr:RtcB family protein [Deferribacterota bacterium]
MGNVVENMKLKKISGYIYEIPRDNSLGMRVKGIVFATEGMLKSIIEEGSLTQVKNAATLPGIVYASIAMPDIHYGYGLPIGGVVATDINNFGVITPGGVGFDINCGVRLTTFAIHKEEIKDKIEELAKNLFKKVPCGVGEGGEFRLNKKEINEVLENGALWAVKKGYGDVTDLEKIESGGKLSGFDPKNISNRAYERGYDQVGTLGSGNHFLEIGYIDEIYMKDIAEKWSLEKGMVTLLIHSGSRGFGHQICTDYLKVFNNAIKKYNIKVPDKQLACAPYYSEESKRYLSALAAAANFAWANREVLGFLAIDAISEFLGISIDKLKANLIYDVAHNIVKIETHMVDNKNLQLAVHRKGATRALPMGHKDLPEIYKNTGQPVIIPGDMGRYSYILVGSAGASKLSFNSACHGAGRVKSRRRAVNDSRNRDIVGELRQKGIIVIGKGKKTIKEEMPDAYKDVSEVVEVVDHLDIAKKVVKIKPLAVIKG